MKGFLSSPKRTLFALSLVLVGTASFAQQTPPQPVLTLAQALRMARERNGDVRAAILDVQASKARVDIAKANFLPTITPQYSYNSSRRQVVGTTSGTQFVQSEGGTSQVNATLRVLDLGERQFNLNSARQNQQAQQSNTLQTLRQILFQVHSRYFDTLRGQELVTAAQAQVARAQSIYDATQAQVQVGQIAKKDLFQAEADLANARVTEFSARNQLANSQASLKAVIGWDSSAPLPPLVASGPAVAAPQLPDLSTMVQQGMERRADLSAARHQVQSQRYQSMLADRQATASLNVDATMSQELTPRSLQDRAFVLNLSLPWLDFGRSRAAARQQKLNYQASSSQLVQLERNAQSEIEAAYQDVKQNFERLTASQTAVEAARQNYAAASESQRLGVSTIVDVITAQASLATAESNYVQALYDYEISAVQLRLVTGDNLPGEEPA